MDLVEKTEVAKSTQEHFFSDLSDFIKKLQVFMKRNKVEAADKFHRSLQEALGCSDIKVQDFVTFLFQKAFPQSNEEEIQ